MGYCGGQVSADFSEKDSSDVTTVCSKTSRKHKSTASLMVRRYISKILIVSSGLLPC